MFALLALLPLPKTQIPMLHKRLLKAAFRQSITRQKQAQNMSLLTINGYFERVFNAVRTASMQPETAPHTIKRYCAVTKRMPW